MFKSLDNDFRYSSISRRHERYSALRAALEKNGEKFENFLANFVLTAPLVTGAFRRRKAEIDERIKNLVISRPKEVADFNEFLSGIFPAIEFGGDSLEDDCIVLDRIEIVLDVLEDYYTEKKGGNNAH